MALYIPHSIFHLTRLLYVRPENFGTYYVRFYGAETWKFRKVYQIFLENIEMRCCRRMVKISRTDRVRKEEELLRVMEQRNILHTIKRRRANWIGHILHRICLLKHRNEGK